MKKNERKEKIKDLKKTNPAFSKGVFWTKAAVVLCLLMLCAIQGFIVWYLQAVNEIALIHMAIQFVVILLMLTGRAVFIWGYGAAMVGSFGMAVWLYLQGASMFYLAQIIYFISSALMMLFLVVNPSARTYRKELRQMKKALQKPLETEQNQEIKIQVQEEVLSNTETEPVSEEIEEHEEEEEFVPVMEVNQRQLLQINCPFDVNVSYGSFSRFLVQHYPFVYLHPRFDVQSSSFVQMCIAAEGFDKQSDELYSGEFLFHQGISEREKTVWLEYSDEMGHLCALICADWLIMQKGTLIQDGININAELMKWLTEAFVCAKNAEKKPFAGFTKQNC